MAIVIVILIVPTAFLHCGVPADGDPPDAVVPSPHVAGQTGSDLDSR